MEYKDIISMVNVGNIHTECANRRREEWQSRNRRTPISQGNYVKRAFHQGDRTEHMWVKVSKVVGTRVYGELNNDPINITSVKCGDHIEFDRSEISDLLTDI